MSLRAPTRPKKADVTQQAIPRNPKYAGVKRRVDTGASLTNYLEHMEDLRKNYRYRRDEIFKRMKATTFAELVIEVVDEMEHKQYDMVERELHTLDEEEGATSQRSTMRGVVTGRGEVDVRGSQGRQQEQVAVTKSALTTCPYLVLDLRDADEFAKSHIIGARHYPASMLSRACNYFTSEIHEYKNKRGHLIVLYDEDERVAANAATVFVQRGVDNVYLLSGGMRVLYRKFPYGLVCGDVPETCLPSPPRSRRAGGRGGQAEQHGLAVPRTPVPITTESITQEHLAHVRYALDNMAPSMGSSVASYRSAAPRGGASSVGGASVSAKSGGRAWK